MFIYFMGIRVVWNVILWVSLGGLFGIVLSSTYLLPILHPMIIKIGFTILVTSLAVVLLIINFSKYQFKRLSVQVKTLRQALFFMALGFIGGSISGLIGNGIDILTFSVLVLVFKLSEKVATPTSVILMAVNALIGFVCNAVFLGNFTPVVESYWLAAIPVVVIGAPLGALICSYMNKKHISWFLVVLIAIELVSTILILPISAEIAPSSALLIIGVSGLYTLLFLNPLKLKI